LIADMIEAVLERNPSRFVSATTTASWQSRTAWTLPTIKMMRPIQTTPRATTSST